MKKYFVLDTNILMTTEGRVINGFDDNTVVLTHITLEELDKLKTAPGERGFQARESIRQIESVIENRKENESINEGITNGNGVFMIIDRSGITVQFEDGWDMTRADNKILALTKALSKEKSDGNVILITNDVAMKIKAEILGIETQSYWNDQIESKEQYSGRETLYVSKDAIDELFEEGYLCLKDGDFPDAENKVFQNNEYVHVMSDSTNQSALACYLEDSIYLIPDNKDEIFGIRPKNMGQRFALHALMQSAEDIPLVILKGPAGTGKTILTLAAALYGTYDDKQLAHYDKILITRSNTLSDEELGFLPGSLEDKMEPLLNPFFDNLKYLLGKNFDGEDKEDKEQVSMQIKDMLDTGVIEITSLAYVRGRSLMNTFLIVDEAQNLTRLQAKTIATRMGQGSKLVLLGDPNQIDNPKLDKLNNGLVYLSEKFKDSPLCSQVEFLDSESVRSALAVEAIERLD